MFADLLGQDTPPRILLTGRPGSGKTTVVARTVRAIGSDGCAGFMTEEVRERGRRIGFDVVTVDGGRAVLARSDAPGPTVGRYGVDVSSFERLGVAALEEAIERNGRIVVIDEIGKMELFSDRFRALLERVFGPAADRPVLATIMAGSHPIVDRIRSAPGVRLITVTSANRDDLPRLLARALARWVGGR